MWGHWMELQSQSQPCSLLPVDPQRNIWALTSGSLEAIWGASNSNSCYIKSVVLAEFFVTFYWLSEWASEWASEWVSEWVRTHHNTHMEVRGQREEADSFLPPCGSQGLNSGHQALVTNAFTKESLCQPQECSFEIYLPHSKAALVTQQAQFTAILCYRYFFSV